MPSSEGHIYNGSIQNAQWVDAQNLKAGYKLLSENNQWQTVKGVSIKREKLSAYNLTVETDHTYFIKGAGEDTDGVWVHNDCWHALPKGAKQVKDIDGYPAYQFKDSSGQTVTVLKKDLNRFERPNHRVGVDPHFNRLSQQIDAETGRYLSTGNAVDGLYNRSYLRSETMQKVFADYEKLPNGDYRNKLSRQVVNNLDRQALLHVKGENGTLQIQANNINLGGADIVNDGKGQTYLSAKNNLNLTALSVGFDEKMGGGNHYRNERKEDVEISRIKGGGDVRLAAKNIYSQGAELESEAKLTALAENDLVLNGAKVGHDFEEFHKTKSGSLAKVTKTRFDKQQSETQRGSQVSGKEIVLVAGHEVKGKGLQAIAENDLLIQAGGNVDIAADTNHFRNIHKETKKTSGVFTGGGGITFGSKSEKHHLESEGWIQSDTRSTLVTDMVQAAYHRVKGREQVSNPKLKALYRIALFREYSKVSLLSATAVDFYRGWTVGFKCPLTMIKGHFCFYKIVICF